MEDGCSRLHEGFLDGEKLLDSSEIQGWPQRHQDRLAGGFADFGDRGDQRLQEVRRCKAAEAPATDRMEAEVVENHVDLRSPTQDAQGRPDGFRCRQIRRIHGIGEDPSRDGQVLHQLRPNLFGEARQLQTEALDLVAGPDAGAAAGACHGDASAPRQGVDEAQRHQCVHHLVEALDLDRLRLPTESLEDGDRAGQARRVSQSGPLAPFGPPSLEDDDRLASSGFAKCSGEAPAVSDTLDVDGDDPGLGILGHVVEKLVLVHVQGVPVAHHLAEAQPPRPPVCRENVRVAATLRDESDGARIQRHTQRVHQTALGHVQAGAIGTDDAESPGPRLLQHLPFQLCSLCKAALAEAGGEEVNGSHPLGSAVVQQGERRLRWDVHHHVVHGSGDAHQVRIAAQSHYLVVLGIDGVDGGEAGVLEALQNDGGESQLSRPGGADHRHSTGSEDFVQGQLHSTSIHRRDSPEGRIFSSGRIVTRPATASTRCRGDRRPRSWSINGGMMRILYFAGMTGSSRCDLPKWISWVTVCMKGSM